MASYDLLNEFIRQGSFAIDKSSVQTTLSAAQAYIASPTAYAGQVLAVTNDSTDNNGAYVVKTNGSSLYLEKIGAGSGNADAPIVHRVTNNSATLSLPTTGDDYLLLPNNSYIYEVALNSLSLNLSAITGATTSTDKFSGYSCIVYFQTSASMTTFTVTNNNASYTFGDYTVSSGTYTFNVLPSTPYIFTVKDNVVTLGPGSADSGAEELMLSALESIRDNVGLEPDYTYVNKPDPVVISGATDIKGAIFLLDDAIGDINDTFENIEGTIDSMGTDIANIETHITNIDNSIISMGTDITNINTTLVTMGTDISTIQTALSGKQNLGTLTRDTSHYNTYTVTLNAGNSYIFTHSSGFQTLTVILNNVTSSTISNALKYEENVYFIAASNTATVVLSGCSASHIYAQYTQDTTTPTKYTISGFTAGQWYCLSVKDNCVACGPIDESTLALVASSSTDYGYLVTGLAVDDHTITYKHLDFSSTDANKYLAGDGHFKAIVSGVSGTCSTASGTAAKVMSVSDFTLQQGVVVNVTFTNTNTALSTTLNVGGSGAKSIFYNGAAISTYNDLEKGGLAGATITYVYDGTNWVWLGNSVDTSRTLCTYAGVTDNTKGFALSGTSPSQTLTVTMYPNHTYCIGQYNNITTLVLDVRNVMQNDSIHTPIHYESIVHFYNGYTLKIKDSDGTPYDAANFSPASHYGSYADLPINQLCFLSVVDQIATFGPTSISSSSTDGYLYPYTLPTASSSTLGGVKTGYTASGNNYSIGISSSRIYATVPLAGLGTRGTMIYPNLGSGYTPIASPQTWTVATNGAVYPIEKTTTNEAFVRVPLSGGGGGGSGTDVIMAQAWVNDVGDNGISSPTIKISPLNLTDYADNIQKAIEEAGGLSTKLDNMWLPLKAVETYSLLPVIIDDNGRLAVAIPTGLLDSYPEGVVPLSK